MFVEIGCFLLDRNLMDLGLNQQAEPAKLSIELNSVESFRESMDGKTQEISNNECLICMKSGDNYIVNISYEGFKELINGY